MDNLEFIQIKRENSLHFETAKKLWIPYFKELNEHKKVLTDVDIVLNNLQKRVSIQGVRSNMHFEICLSNERAIGIANFAVDLGGIKGILDPGYGFIMEFYISKDFRRQGYGRCFYNHIEKVFLSHGVGFIYLTPDKITGQAFWTKFGFYNSGKVDPDNKMPIYIKKISL